MLKTSLKPLLCLLAFAIAGPACGIDVRTEKLGPLPVAVLTSEDDLKLWEPQSLEELAKYGYAVEPELCIKAPHDRRIGAVVPKQNGKCCVWLDGKENAIYDQVRNTVRGAYKSQEFRFSPDGQRLAYTARKGKKWVMVVDGEESAEFDGLREPYFSADSKHICYVGFRDKDCILVVDSKERAKYPGIEMAFPTFSARTPLRVRDGGDYCPVVFGANGRFAFAASKGRDREVVVIDGKESSEYENIRGIEFSPDGKHMAFAAEKGGRMFVVLDGRVGPKYDDIDGMLTFSPNGQRLAYVAANFSIEGDAQSFVVVDGKPGPRFNDIYSISILFSSDSKHVTYTAACNDGRYCVVVDDKPGKVYDEVGGYGGEACQIYGPDGKLYYTARHGDKYYMVVDGVASSGYDDIVDPLPVFSPNGKHYAFVARSGGQWFVVKDGVKGVGYAGIYGSSLAVTDNKFGYIAIKPNAQEYMAVIDDNEQAGVYRMAMSSDGTRMACLRDSGDYMNPVKVTLNGEEIGKFFSVLKLNFNSDNTLTFLAVRDNTTADKIDKCLYRVQATLGKL